MAYLDENGVATLWERIQKLIYQCTSHSSECSCEPLTNAEIDEATPIVSEGDVVVL